MVQADACSEVLFIEEAVTQLIAEGLAVRGRVKVGWPRRWGQKDSEERTKARAEAAPKTRVQLGLGL
jgi:hypothetical protein